MRILLKFIATLLLALIAGCIVLLFYFDPNNYKTEINQFVSNKIGRTFAIKGDLRWTFFPTLGFEARDIAIDPTIHIQSAVLDVKLQPLLQRRIEANTLSLNGVSFTSLYTAQSIRLRGEATETQAQGTISVRHLVLNGLQVNTLSALITLSKEKVHFDQIRGQLYDGTLQGTGTITLSSEPSFNFHQDLSRIHIATLLKDLTSHSRLDLDGQGNLSVDLTTRGKTATEIQRNLNGKIHFDIAEGALHGIDINYWLALGSAAYHQEAVPKISDTHTTPFDTFQANFNISQGIASNNDLLLQTSLARTTGKGQIDLLQHTLDFHLDTVKLDPNTHQPHHDVVPILISGPLADPSIKLDLAAIFKAVGKNVLQNQINQFQGKAGEQLKNIDVDKLLKAIGG